jgi:protoporphyrinogen/coproporphyrinogen III oxidase
MTEVAVIGGGISGLCAAWQLSQSGISFTLYESTSRVGGMIGTDRRDGYLLERGPGTLLATSPQITALLTALGLDDRIVLPSATAKRRYIVKQGRLEALPQSPLEALATPLLSTVGKLRVLAEPFVHARRERGQESLANFVNRRLGGEVLDYFVNPFIGGIYAGDPQRLSVEHAFPKLFQLEQEYGSLMMGAVLGARKRAGSADKSKLNARMFAFDDGMQVLIDALSRTMHSSIRAAMAATGVERTGAGWRIEFEHGRPVEHSAVLLCAPAHRIGRLLSSAGTDFSPLRRINYPPIVRVVLGFKRSQVAHPLDGFGALIPAAEPFQSLGVFFSSSVFPNRAPDGHVGITVFVGGARRPELCAPDGRRALDAALSDTRRLLGISGSPEFQDVSFISRSIPQYELGYVEIKRSMDRLEQQSPGLFLAGNYRDGISAADSILSGLNAAQRIAAFTHNETDRNSSHQYRVA